VPNRIGQQLGNYKLTQLLGQGGFAEVYLGEHVYLKVPAAIKVLHTQLSDRDDIESFLREAQFVARLAHPNIVRVLDFGIVEQVPFLVMDYAQNGTLRQRYPRGTQLPLAPVVSYVKQVASALQYAHDERLIHRDIKPENMLLGRHDEVLLSDFGIALVAQSSRYQNEEDVIGGTAAYMSPEQIQGKSRPASDQYSLAIVVYEWLTGERPFQGSFNGDSANQSLLLCLLSMLIAIIFIVGTKFGPWVGFIVPFAGSLAPERLLIHNSITSTLPYSLIVASAGFVVGLAFVATRGDYRSGKSIGLAVLTSILGVAVACIGDSIVESGASITLIIESGIIALVLLPFALLLANRFEKPADQQTKQ
jgi:serine/threonine protein kinase